MTAGTTDATGFGKACGHLSFPLRKMCEVLPGRHQVTHAKYTAVPEDYSAVRRGQRRALSNSTQHAASSNQLLGPRSGRAAREAPTNTAVRQCLGHAPWHPRRWHAVAGVRLLASTAPMAPLYSPPALMQSCYPPSTPRC